MMQRSSGRVRATALGWTTWRRFLSYPQRVKIVEVGPRDGLQNEKELVSTADKLELIRLLNAAKVRHIEATSFVSPKWVPQMGDAAEVMQGVRAREQADRNGFRSMYSVLTPNMRGYKAAAATGVDEVAVFAAATESFSQKNTNASTEQVAERHREIMEAARSDGIPVRGYVSCVLGCPYEGAVSPDAVAKATSTLLEMGCFEVSLGDTIGTGSPLSTQQMLEKVLQVADAPQLAAHFHNTYGTALANLLVALDHGIATVDSSVGGLGGCPYAKGATGNVATEDVVNMLHAMGIETGLDLDKLVDASVFITGVLGMQTRSNAGAALLGKR